MEKNTKGIRAFLHDAKAVSPAIATLILIVIAAVAAAGVGMLVSSSQQNAEEQTANKNLDVNGEFDIKGSTTVLPVSEAEISEFVKQYPAITINLGGGGSGTGRALVFNKQVDVAASSDIWQTGPTTDPTTGLQYDGRESAVIQAAGQDAFIYETKIGTGMIVVAGNIPGVATINVVNQPTGSNVTGTAPNMVLNLNMSDLVSGYNTGTIIAIGPLSAMTTVQRSDDSGTEETFAKWIGLADSANNNQLKSTVLAVGAQGNQGIRDYIDSHTNSIGFVDIGFAKGGVNGKVNVIPASQNGVVASKTTKGVGKDYDIASKTVSGISKGLARDLYYYSQGIPTGAQKAYFDFVLSNDGQTILEQTGFFRP